MPDDLAHYSATQPHEAPTLDAVLAWLQRRRAEKVPAYPDRSVQRAHLRHHGHTLVALDPATEEVLTACGRPGPVPGAVGRQGGGLLVQYFRWSEDFADLRVEPYLQYFHDELAAAASFRQSMVRAALQLAFSNDPYARSDSARAALTGLGETHARLNELLDHLSAVSD